MEHSARSLKFRAWHIGAGEMIMEAAAGDVFKWEREKQPIEIMQYTGLKDKNGVEIWESDILQESIYKREKHHRYLVQYDDGDAKFYAQNQTPEMKQWIRCGEAMSRLEVIGNIYENGDLIDN